MAGQGSTLQDLFLNAVRRAHQPVSLFVMKGVRLQGVVTGFDAFSLTIRREGRTQLAYKHSIATIMPSGPVEGLEFPEAADDPKMSLQDRFLADLSRSGGSVTLFLVNGVMLEGEVAGFDQFSVVLRRGDLAQLIYKHAISTIQPSELWDGPRAERREREDAA